MTCTVTVLQRGGNLHAADATFWEIENPGRSVYLLYGVRGYVPAS